MKLEMKILGGRNMPPASVRFDRLQRTAHLLLGRPVSPRGVFRFKSFEEFNAWTMQICLRPAPHSK
ncbi:MAG: hypothetical protein HY360_14130 [Verrucomicrobia bacterium]|nr:hypothetical protein [Verrucomicrobiota bacterium]